MNGNGRLKRQLFRGIADENIEAISDQPRGSLRRQRARRTLFRRRVLLAACGALVATVTGIASLGMFPDAGSGENPQVTVNDSMASFGSVPPGKSEGTSLLSDLADVITGRRAHPIEPEVIPLAVQTVVLDPGHGGADSGTLTPFGMLEKDLTWDIARRLNGLLEKSKCSVVLTRHEDQDVSLKERTEIANRVRADLFVSIHVNWLPDREARGFEIYFAGTTVDPFLKSLAAAENSNSGFSVADTRQLLDGIYAGVRQLQSRRLAGWVGNSLYATLRANNPEVIHRGVMRAPFVVLIATEMPAVLVEVACLSNDREAKFMAQPGYRQRIAEALFTGIRDYAGAVSAKEKGDNT